MTTKEVEVAGPRAVVANLKEDKAAVDLDKLVVAPLGQAVEWLVVEEDNLEVEQGGCKM